MPAAFLNKAVRVDPKDSRPRLALVGMYAGQGDLSRAEDEIRKGIAVDPQSAQWHLVLGDTYARQQ